MRDKGLRHCIVDFKKDFDVVPCKRLSRSMEEREVSNEYIFATSQIYEKVICCVCMGSKM